MSTRIIRVWDLPTRLFHWLLVLAVTGAIITGELRGDLFVWHGRFGIAILGLLVFRLVWGLVGSTYARFASFMPSSLTIRNHLDGVWRGAGHNPFGALSVLAMLGVLLCQAGTGLFSSANRDHFQGPLYDLVGKTLSHTLSDVHEFIFNFTIAFLVLHIAAIAYYVRIEEKEPGPGHADRQCRGRQRHGPARARRRPAGPDRRPGPGHRHVWLVGSGTLVKLLA